MHEATSKHALHRLNFAFFVNVLLSNMVDFPLQSGVIRREFLTRCDIALFELIPTLNLLLVLLRRRT
ncbi:hypothetical protein KCO_16167 [Pectobacterium brasiliense ICMP 19477]|nr:hypothetical protein KCO_16167 [Pectobacterium brasiliense ICMP 19477]